jgi:hypothetical protein
MLPLWSETHVAKNWNASSGDFLDGWYHLLATLDLDALDPALLDETDGSGKGLLRGDLVCTHGKISDLERDALVVVGERLWTGFTIP